MLEKRPPLGVKREQVPPARDPARKSQVPGEPEWLLPPLTQMRAVLGSRGRSLCSVVTRRGQQLGRQMKPGLGAERAGVNSQQLCGPQ